MKTTVLLLVLAICFPLSAGTIARVSILSLLNPEEVQLTALDANTFLEIDGIRRPFPTNSTIQITAAGQLLRLPFLSDPARNVSVACNRSCRIRIEIPGVIGRTYEGALHLKAVDDHLQLVLHTPVEPLVAGITASEMGEFSEPEAARAFAIVARTFIQAGMRHPEAGADVCDTTHCQVFRALQPDRLVSQAVSSTSGYVLKYRHQIFRPYYSRSCGGRTATFAETWQEPSPDYPFFPVQCDACMQTPETWTFRMNTKTLEVLSSRKRPSLTMTGGLLYLTGTDSTTAFTPENFRILAGHLIGWNRIQSNQFEVRPLSGDYSFQGKGSGHRVGLCQKGAAQMAEDGKQAQEILLFYFPETFISAN